MAGCKAEHERTRRAREAGAKIREVRPGYLSVVQSRARQYCAETGAHLLPFGLDCPEMVVAIAQLARERADAPREVWSVAGSGTLTRGLQVAWPDARVIAVRVGKEPDAGRAELLCAPEAYERGAELPPPFPACSNYDAKAWRFIVRHAADGALFWNVAA